MRIGVVQLSVSDDPSRNLSETISLIEAAVDDGADVVYTPEVTNLLCTDRTRQREILQTQETDITLAALQEIAKTHKIWIHIGSLALRQEGHEKFLNRGFVLNPSGDITAQYDKIHLFDVSVSASEIYQESAAYQSGDQAVVTPFSKSNLGLSICYDLRFPHLYRDLARAGANIISVPGAFSVATGPDHVEVLLRARAIETGSFIVMAAQTGEHSQSTGKSRKTWGHSMVIDPWGQKLVDMSETPGFTCVNIDLNLVKETRSKIPSIATNPEYKKP